MGRHDNERIVRQYDLQGNFIGEYPSISEAARIMGCSKNAVWIALNKQNHTACGFIWKYAYQIVCDSNCFNCKYNDCINDNPKRTAFEESALKLAFMVD